MLFGHQNDDTNQAAESAANVTTPGVNPLAVDSDTGASLPVVPAGPVATDTPASEAEPSILDQPAADTSTAPVVSPVASTPADASLTRPTAAPSVASGDSDLLGLKQQALTQLSPLLNHLDQTPEEKFRTTMMLIQSTDNHALLKDAYEAAQIIGDDKVRAQALLDVVNEINYFTQPKAS